MKRKIKSILMISLLCCVLCMGCQKEKIVPISVLRDIDKTVISALERECKMLLIVQEKKDTNYQRVEEISVPTEEEIKTYLNMTIEEIEKLTGITIDDKDKGTLMIFSFAAAFPCLYPDDCSFYFVCRDYDKTQKPLYLSIYGEYFDEYLSTIGLSETMSFEEIEELWGKGEWNVSQRGDGDDYRYMLTFKRNGLIYDFVSVNPEGYNFDFNIALP